MTKNVILDVGDKEYKTIIVVDKGHGEAVVSMASSSDVVTAHLDEPKVWALYEALGKVLGVTDVR